MRTFLAMLRFVLLVCALALASGLLSQAYAQSNCSQPSGQCGAYTFTGNAVSGVDALRLSAVGSHLHLSFSGTNDYLASNGTGIFSPGTLTSPVFVVAAGSGTALGRVTQLSGIASYVAFTQNLSFNGADFIRDNIAIGGLVLALDARFGNERMTLFATPPGANPAALTQLLTIDYTSGGLEVTGVVQGDLGFNANSHKATQLADGTAATDAATVGQLRSHSYFAFGGYNSLSAASAKVTIAKWRSFSAGAAVAIDTILAAAGIGASTYKVAVEDVTTSTILCESTATTCTAAPTVVTCLSSNTWAAADELAVEIESSGCTTNPIGNVTATLQHTP